MKMYNMCKVIVKESFDSINIYNESLKWFEIIIQTLKKCISDITLFTFISISPVW